LQRIGSEREANPGDNEGDAAAVGGG
jgi:hypothetical protein